MALDGSGNITITWPCDCNTQDDIMKSVLVDIQAQNVLLQAKVKKQIQIFSKNQPSTAQWQTEWLLKGNTLPLPTGLQCLWFNTTLNTYGAEYYVINSIPYPVEMKMYKGISSILVYPSSIDNVLTTLTTSAAGLTHWDVATQRAFGINFTIPAHLVGKNYFVKFYIPFMTNVDAAMNWTIWYEGTNLYTTLFAGTGIDGFGSFASTGALTKTSIIEWTAEIPAGGVQTTIAVRIAANTGPATQVWVAPYGADNLGSVTNAGGGRMTAEFTLKTE